MKESNIGHGQGMDREIKFKLLNLKTFELSGWERLENNERRNRWVEESKGSYGNGRYSGSFIRLQYTGLKDQKGVEIYQGDIYKISRDSTIRVVDYNDNHGGWDRAYAIEELGDIPSEEYEVIGNIYQNKELMSE